MEGLGGYHLMGSGPRLQFIGPELPFGMNSPIRNDNLANSMDRGVPKDAGSGSNLSNTVSDSSKRNSSRRHRRLRERKETCHSRQRAPIRSKNPTRAKDQTSASSNEPDGKVTHAINDQSCAETGDSKTYDESSKASMPSPEIEEECEQQPDKVDESLAFGKSRKMEDPAKEEIPSLTSTKEKKTHQGSKSVNLEVVLPVRDIRKLKAMPGNFHPKQLSRSGDVTREDIQQWISAICRQITRHVKPPEVFG